ncbi:MAG: hypothetical protein P9M15_01775 [Candidatus Electryoneaceae bacterium]|nr:hypothetical protein [Candidatus Electryoneaceae bacterium]
MTDDFLPTFLKPMRTEKPYCPLDATTNKGARTTAFILKFLLDHPGLPHTIENIYDALQAHHLGDDKFNLKHVDRVVRTLVYMRLVEQYEGGFVACRTTFYKAINKHIESLRDIQINASRRAKQFTRENQ